MALTPRVIIEEEPSSQITPIPSPILLPPSPVFEQTAIASQQNGFAKLVHTVQFVKKWAQNAEELSSGKNEFLNRFTQRPSDNPGMVDESGWVAVGKKRCKGYVFPPNSRILYWWMGVVTLVVFYNSFVIIARQTFNQLQEEVWSIVVWLIVDYLADMVYILDIVVQFRTGMVCTCMKSTCNNNNIINNNNNN